MPPLADDGPRTCVWRSCSLHGQRTTDERCPECGTPTEGVAGYVGGTLTFDPTVLRRPLIVTMNDIPGYRITEVHGDVFGLIVMARDAFTNLGASLRALAGGELTSYTELLTSCRNQARARLWAEATALGANAVVAFRFDCNDFGTVMSEVVAYGTAVTVERIAAEPPPDTT